MTTGTFDLPPDRGGPSAELRTRYAHINPQVQRLAWDFAGTLISIATREALEMPQTLQATQASGKQRGRRKRQRPDASEGADASSDASRGCIP